MMNDDLPFNLNQSLLFNEIILNFNASLTESNLDSKHHLPHPHANSKCDGLAIFRQRLAFT